MSSTRCSENLILVVVLGDGFCSFHRRVFANATAAGLPRRKALTLGGSEWIEFLLFWAGSIRAHPPEGDPPGRGVDRHDLDHVRPAGTSRQRLAAARPAPSGQRPARGRGRNIDEAQARFRSPAAMPRPGGELLERPGEVEVEVDAQGLVGLTPELDDDSSALTRASARRCLDVLQRDVCPDQLAEVQLGDRASVSTGRASPSLNPRASHAPQYRRATNATVARRCCSTSMCPDGRRAAQARRAPTPRWARRDRQRRRRGSELHRQSPLSTPITTPGDHRLRLAPDARGVRPRLHEVNGPVVVGTIDRPERSPLWPGRRGSMRARRRPAGARVRAVRRSGASGLDRAAARGGRRTEVRRVATTRAASACRSGGEGQEADEVLRGRAGARPAEWTRSWRCARWRRARLWATLSGLLPPGSPAGGAARRF